MGLSRGARGALVIASKARCGPIPLRLAYVTLRGIGAGSVGAGSVPHNYTKGDTLNYLDAFAEGLGTGCPEVIR
jgi:hypothetical protein